MEIGGFITSGAEIVNHDNSLSGNGTVDSPLGLNDYIKMLNVNKPHTANADNFTITATIPTDYKFLCWVNMKTNGFSQAFYPLSPDSSATTWWKGGSMTNPTSNSTVTCYYLVVKNGQTI